MELSGRKRMQTPEAQVKETNPVFSCARNGMGHNSVGSARELLIDGDNRQLALHKSVARQR